MLITALFIIPPNLESIQMLINWWLVRQTVHPHCVILLSNEKEGIADVRSELVEAPENYAE